MTSMDGETRKYNWTGENTSNAANPSSSGIGGNGDMTGIVTRLLPEIVSDILSRLSIEDVMRYRSVCKGWRYLTKDPHFIQMHLSRGLCLPRRIILEPRVIGPITSLYLLDRVGGAWRGREISIKNIPGNYMFAACSCQGLLCVASSKPEGDPLVIYNPITQECMELPKAKTNFEVGKTYISVGFGFDPTSKKYKVVLLFKVCDDNDSQFYMKGQIVTLGEGSWRELEVSHTVICNSPLFLDGALHWVIDKASHPGCEQILALDLCNETFRTIKFPSSIIQSINRPEKVILLNFKGSLSLVELATSERFRLWRLERINSKKGFRFYQSSYSMSMAHTGHICSLKLMEGLIDDSFLFHVVVHLNFRGKDEKKDHLSLYLPGKDNYQVLDVFGIPNLFHPNLFIPSLVSPCYDFGKGAQEIDLS